MARTKQTARKTHGTDKTPYARAVFPLRGLRQRPDKTNVVMNCCCTERKCSGSHESGLNQLKKPGTLIVENSDNSSNSDSDVQVTDSISESSNKRESKRKMPSKSVKELSDSDDKSDSDFVSRNPPKKISKGNNLNHSQKHIQLVKEGRQKINFDEQENSQSVEAKKINVNLRCTTTKSSPKKEQNKDLYCGSGPSRGRAVLKPYIFVDSVLEDLDSLSDIMKDRARSLKDWFIKNHMMSNDAFPLVLDKLQRILKFSSDSLSDINSHIDKYENSLFMPKQEVTIGATGELHVKTETVDSYDHNEATDSQDEDFNI